MTVLNDLCLFMNLLSLQLHLKTMPHLMYKLITGQIMPLYHYHLLKAHVQIKDQLNDILLYKVYQTVLYFCNILGCLQCTCTVHVYTSYEMFSYIYYGQCGSLTTHVYKTTDELPRMRTNFYIHVNENSMVYIYCTCIYIP